MHHRHDTRICDVISADYDVSQSCRFSHGTAHMYLFLLKAKHDDAFFRAFYYIRRSLVLRCHTRVEKNDNGVLCTKQKLQMFLYQLQIIACLVHFTEEKCLMLKNDEKARCRALHAFLGLCKALSQK